MPFPLNMLIIDDNQDFADNIGEVLSENGYTVSIANDGKTALKLVRNTPFDLVILDYNLPDINGLDLQKQLSEIRKMDYIIITGFATVESAAEAVKREQIVGYETKPLDFDRFLAFVNQAAGRIKAQRLSKATRDELDTLFEGVRALIWQKDLEGRYMKVNNTYCETVGLPRESIVGKRDDELYPSDIAEKYSKYDRKIIETGAPQLGIEEPHLKPDGKRGWGLADKFPFYDNMGAIAGTTGFALDITSRKNSEEQLKKSLKEKEILLRELYHRTKNNMQVISGMLCLQSACIQDKGFCHILKELENKIQTMALVHKKLYQSRDLSKIDLRDYLQDLMGLLIESYADFARAVNIELQLESTPVLIDLAIPCGLVVNELVSNSFKHAFPNGNAGEIRISLFRNPSGLIELRFADSGPGLTEGFDLKTLKTLGFQTIFMIVEHEMKGNVVFENDNGLSCRITFTDTHYKERV